MMQAGYLGRLAGLVGAGYGEGDCQGTRSVFLCPRDTASRDEIVRTRWRELRVEIGASTKGLRSKL